MAPRYFVHVTDDRTHSGTVSWASEPVSWARNGEDVVLLRALGHVTDGRFLEVRAGGAQGPPTLQALVDRGWVGAVADEVSDLDSNSDSSSDSDSDSDSGVGGTGPLHVALIAADVTAADHDRILRLAGRRPWVLLVGVHPDHDRTPLVEALAAAGYRCRLYDGVSAYFVAADHDADLGPALSYPACARDGYGPGVAAAALREARRREAAALESALRWKQKAVQSWADNSTGEPIDPALRERADDLARQLELLQETLSWRITAPLRSVRRLRSAGPA